MNALREKTTQQYDRLNRVVKTINPLGDATTIVFDPAGRMISTTNAENETTLQRYDKANRQIESETPMGFVTTTTYDKAGRAVAN